MKNFPPEMIIEQVSNMDSLKDIQNFCNSNKYIKNICDFSKDYILKKYFKNKYQQDFSTEKMEWLIENELSYSKVLLNKWDQILIDIYDNTQGTQFNLKTFTDVTDTLCNLFSVQLNTGGFLQYLIDEYVHDTAFSEEELLLLTFYLVEKSILTKCRSRELIEIIHTDLFDFFEFLLKNVTIEQHTITHVVNYINKIKPRNYQRYLDIIKNSIDGQL